ncbi:hypothetical protein Dxin01_02920 [Deinococcus xinjiangensis]|uniref:Uncharacterized protein n=1 Tax=Deinococcus xinjiangensis TaxID=457454 RepID=A0ABP9VEL6_9DEIO
MATYKEWNNALIEYFTYGAPVNSTIYLHVSDHTLELIGQQFWGDAEAGVNGWAEDYLQAVKQALVKDGCVFPETVRGLSKRGRPQGVAFLGALVLVATRMENDDEQSISEKDYLTRLNDALETQPANAQVRRPRHMTSGAEGEEPLWQAWANYLRSRGYLPTASGGRGAWKYIGYAVSQTLIREPEKRRLFQIFESRGWGKSPDPSFLVHQLRYEDVPRHVSTLLRREGQAAEDVAHAVQDVYQEWLQKANSSIFSGTSNRVQLQSRHLIAGIYRTEHFRTGQACYALFPRQPRGVRLLELQATLPNGEQETLQLERPGYYAPLGEVAASNLSNGMSLYLTGHPLLEDLVLPTRQLWLLRADPDNVGAYATLGRPGIGEHVLLLVRSTLQPDLELLREQGLVNWQTVQPLSDDWHEFHGLMVVANHWQDVSGVKSRELLETLRPTTGLSVSLAGGLRLPQAGAWLGDGPPQVSVNSFFTEAEVTLSRDGITLFSGTVETNTPLNLTWDGPGDYEVMAEARGQGEVRLIKLLDWTHLPAPNKGNLGQFRSEWRNGAETLTLLGATVQAAPEQPGGQA